jgi:uncharacterized protein HemX
MEALKLLGNTATGKAVALAAMVLLLISIILGVWVYVLQADNRSTQSEKAAVQAQLDAVAGQLVQNYQQYEDRINEAKQNRPAIINRYITTIQNIEKGADKNETCDEAMRALDATDF